MDRLDDCEEERLAVQGPSSINVKVNKASKVYEVKYSKNGQVQTYNHKKAEHPNKKGKPKTKKSTPLSGKKSCKFRVQSSVIQNSTGVQSIEGFQGPIDGQNQTGSQNPADGQIPAPTSPQSPAGFQVSKSTISGAKSPVSFQGPVDGQNQAESRNPGGQSSADGQNSEGLQEIENGQTPTPISPQSPAGFQVFRSTVSGAKSPTSFKGLVDGQNQAESRNPGGQSPASGQNPAGFQETADGQIPADRWSPTSAQSPKANAQSPAGF